MAPARGGTGAAIVGEAERPRADAIAGGLEHGKTRHIKVTEGNGYLCNLELNAVVEASPEEVWELLIKPAGPTSPANMEELYRRVLEDDGQGRRHLEVGSRIRVRLTIIPLSFEMHIKQFEDRKSHVLTTELVRSGMVSRLKSRWAIQPLSEDAFSAWQRQAETSPHAGASCVPASLSPKARRAMCLLTVQQSMSPRMALAPGMKGKFRNDRAKDLEATLDRLLKELHMRRELAAVATAANKDDDDGSGSSVSTTTYNTPTRPALPVTPLSLATGSGSSASTTTYNTPTTPLSL